MEYYNQENFYFINLGDCEELWENTMFGIAKYNEAVYAMEKRFILRDAYCKVFGNHDLFWDNDPLASVYLKKPSGYSPAFLSGQNWFPLAISIFFVRMVIREISKVTEMYSANGL